MIFYNANCGRWCPLIIQSYVFYQVQLAQQVGADLYLLIGRKVLNMRNNNPMCLLNLAE